MLTDSQQVKSKLYSKCITCGSDIYEGEEFIEAAGYDYCDDNCYIVLALEEGSIHKRIAGDDITRII